MAAERLGVLVDKIIKECPDAVILVARIISTCDETQQVGTVQYQNSIPEVMAQRRAAGAKLLVVDFTTFPVAELRDCIHPTNNGYRILGDYWLTYINQIPGEWISDPVGPDPDRSDEGDFNANGGLDDNIPLPNWGDNPVAPSSKEIIQNAARIAGNEPLRECQGLPVWHGAGQIALGLGRNGDWHFNKNWVPAGKVADGINRDHRFVRYALIPLNYWTLQSM